MRSFILQLGAESPCFRIGYLQQQMVAFPAWSNRQISAKKKSGIHSHHPPLLTPLLTYASLGLGNQAMPWPVARLCLARARASLKAAICFVCASGSFL